MARLRDLHARERGVDLAMLALLLVYFLFVLITGWWFLYAAKVSDSKSIRSAILSPLFHGSCKNHSSIQVGLRVYCWLNIVYHQFF